MTTAIILAIGLVIIVYLTVLYLQRECENREIDLKIVCYAIYDMGWRDQKNGLVCRPPQYEVLAALYNKGYADAIYGKPSMLEIIQEQKEILGRIKILCDQLVGDLRKASQI